MTKKSLQRKVRRAQKLVQPFLRILRFFFTRKYLSWLTATIVGSGGVQSSCSSPVASEVLVEEGSWSYPKELKVAVERVRTYYPELDTIKLSFYRTTDFQGSIMQAQPVKESLWRRAARREYKVEMQPLIKLQNDTVPITSMPEDIMVGWLGHELGHIVDYTRYSSLGLIGLGIGYSLSDRYLMKVEMRADSIAAAHGLGPEIIAVKRFILEEKPFPEWYKDQIRDLYPSSRSIEVLLPESDLPR